jgi:lipopolysaccharide/colanic/teichoic acid biosynthesis glycosyltransferase
MGVVNFKNILKYLIRFVFLQSLISVIMIYSFDNYIFLNTDHKYSIYLKLIEDRNRFYSFIPESIVTIDLLFILIVFVFLILLYSSKFYTYVNELDFSYENRFIDDYFILYLLWNSFLFSSLYIFRINELSRLNLVWFTFLVPLLLILFRNSEIISILLGRSVSSENYVSFNLDENSNFKNLRILAFRSESLSVITPEELLSSKVIKQVDTLNKTININLVVIKIKNLIKLDKDLEEYLINLNKKVLIISDENLDFNKSFIHRSIKLDSKNLYYFNNDIQYGAKFIFKRIFDIIVSVIASLLLMPLLSLTALLIIKSDSTPSVIKQSRIGLHGKKFKMYKFRTMYKDTHGQRQDLKETNRKSGPLFKLDSDPRVIKGLDFLRKFSLDELPQLLNVIKGDMSLVGPRPLFEEDTEYFDMKYMRRLNVLPGMTGLLQINERNTDDFEIWYKYDIEYIDNWSLYLDIKILFKTIKVAFGKKNSGK